MEARTFGVSSPSGMPATEMKSPIEAAASKPAAALAAAGLEAAREREIGLESSILIVF